MRKSTWEPWKNARVTYVGKHRVGQGQMHWKTERKANEMKRKLEASLVPRAFPLRKGKVPPGILQGITGRLLRNSLENERNMTQKREETPTKCTGNSTIRSMNARGRAEDERPRERGCNKDGNFICSIKAVRSPTD